MAGVGAEVHDLLFDERFLLADVELSHTAHPDLLVATRLLCFEGFVMTTGVNVVFDPGLGTLVQSFSGLAGRASELNLRLSSFSLGSFSRSASSSPTRRA